MLFNSLHFALFFLIFYILYLAFQHKWQNRILLAANLVFYAFWDWRFLSLIAASIAFNYYLGLKIDASENQNKRKALLVVSIFLNLAMLGFFKYYNFFAGSLKGLFHIFGLSLDMPTLNIILPLGISFYTFQAMSYTIDIYRRVIKATKSFLDLALFISFFPLLAAGPIERARNMLPQIAAKREVTPDKFYEGAWLFFWGLYKKIVIADNLAAAVSVAFDKPGLSSPGGIVLIGMYALAFQVYADFSGYSDMARGIARAMGFNVMVNFRVPFFSSNIYDFWQRWHISLTTWIKEYVYYPLALAKFFGHQIKARLVIIITWAIMGFWHGAAWTYVLWGVYHGFVIVIYNRIRPYLILIKLKKSRTMSNILLTGKMLFIFHIFCVGILFFAVKSPSEVLTALKKIVFDFSTIYDYIILAIVQAIVFVVPLLVMEYFQYKSDNELVVFKWPALIRSIVYFIVFYSIIMYGDFSAQKYYYFQF